MHSVLIHFPLAFSMPIIMLIVVHTVHNSAHLPAALSRVNLVVPKLSVQTTITYHINPRSSTQEEVCNCLCSSTHRVATYNAAKPTIFSFTHANMLVENHDTRVLLLLLREPLMIVQPRVPARENNVSPVSYVFPASIVFVDTRNHIPFSRIYAFSHASSVKVVATAHDKNLLSAKLSLIPTSRLIVDIIITHNAPPFFQLLSSPA